MLNQHELERMRSLQAIPKSQRSSAEDAELEHLVRKHQSHVYTFVSRDGDMPEDERSLTKKSISRDPDMP